MDDPSLSYNDDEVVESHLSKSQSLELAYQESLRAIDTIVKDEGTRRLRLRIHMLENENDDLHEQLEVGDDRIEVLEEEFEDLRAQLELAQEEASQYDIELKSQVRELTNLKAELLATNNLNKDSAKLLTDKLELARELSNIKPELDHLRAQSSVQQTMLSEKLALQRQVSTLEVELETEKRASHRAAQKNNNKEREQDLEQQVTRLQKELNRAKREHESALQDAERELETERKLSKRVTQKNTDSTEKESELQCQIEQLHKDLAREKREREKARKDAEKDLKASENRCSILESKLDQLRSKFRDAKEQLKDLQTELAQSRAAAVKAECAAGAPKNSRKRGANEISADDAIGTPDGVAGRGKRHVAKRGRMEPTIVGEKSMFSITPFLNRTVNLTTDLTVKDGILEDEDHDAATSKLLNLKPAPVSHELEMLSAAASPVPKFSSKNKKTLAETPSLDKDTVLSDSTGNLARTKKSAPSKPRKPATLEIVMEEELAENVDPPDTNIAKEQVSEPLIFKNIPVIKATKPNARFEDEAGQRKKKRKLIGGNAKTLFDEDDGEASKRPIKVALGPPRLVGRGGLGALKGAAKGGVGASSGFSAFSPLKKDRRGVGASFLA